MSKFDSSRDPKLDIVWRNTDKPDRQTVYINEKATRRRCTYGKQDWKQQQLHVFVEKGRGWSFRVQSQVIREDCLGHYRHQTPPATWHCGTGQMQRRTSCFLSLTYMKIGFKIHHMAEALHIKENKLPQSIDRRLNWNHSLWHVTNMQNCDTLKWFRVVAHRSQRNNPITMPPG